MTRAISAWRSRLRPGSQIVVVPGSAERLDALLPLHYRGGRPATIERVLVAIDAEHDQLAGVLATSRPVLNGSWREAAFGERFGTGDRSADALAINADLRTISRVIVDPRYRGLGVGTALVRAYLAAPDTRCTEAITALGPVCPIFARAGMRECPVPRPARHDRLVRALHAETDLDAARRLLDRRSPEAERALRQWARASASTRRQADGDAEALASLAAGALLAPAKAYAHG